jgi:hypothetical protein
MTRIIKYKPDDYYLIEWVDGKKLAFNLGQGIEFEKLIQMKHEYEDSQKQYWNEDNNESRKT